MEALGEGGADRFLLKAGDDSSSSSLLMDRFAECIWRIPTGFGAIGVYCRMGGG